MRLQIGPKIYSETLSFNSYDKRNIYSTMRYGRCVHGVYAHKKISYEPTEPVDERIIPSRNNDGGAMAVVGAGVGTCACIRSDA
jgi:hypothetical protein